MYTCGACKERKDAKEFDEDVARKAASNHRLVCRDCMMKKAKWRGMHTCIQCKEKKSVGEFGKHFSIHASSNHRKRCDVCMDFQEELYKKVADDSKRHT